MTIVINTNVPSLMAQAALNDSGLELATALERLSTGLRINSAADDAAGLAIADTLQSQIGGLQQAVQNANDGISLAQTAEGALKETTSLLQRMRNLAVQSINDSNDEDARNDMQLEVAQLQQEINRVSSTTQFGTKNLLDGSFTNQNLQVGAFAGNTITFSIPDTSGSSLGNNTVSGLGTIQDAVLGNAASNNVAAQNLTVSGNSGSAVITVTAAQSASSIAAAINNNTNTTGVSATASTTATLSNLSGNGYVTMNLDTLTGGAVAVSATVSTTNLTELMNAINNVSAQTGITAATSPSLGDGALILTSSTGTDIAITDYTNTAAPNATIDVTGSAGATVTVTAGGANAGAIVGGVVVFSSDTGFTLTSNNANNTLLAAQSETSALSNVSSIDISTSPGATAAIAVIDAAVQQIDDTRATLGAIENRLNYTIDNLTDIANNEAAAESRIRDADFAQETANLTRAQILQQAGTAILSQANAVPELALKLLQ